MNGPRSERATTVYIHGTRVNRRAGTKAATRRACQAATSGTVRRARKAAR